MKRICSVCGRTTPVMNDICELARLKEKLGFIGMQLQWNFNQFKILHFCFSCSKKSYTIEELVSLCVSNPEWSY